MLEAHFTGIHAQSTKITIYDTHMTGTAKTKKTVITNKKLKMGKGHMVAVVREHTNLNKDDATTVVNALLDKIKEHLIKGSNVGLPGIGTLTVKATKARKGNLPGSKETFTTEPGRKISFRPSTTMKEQL